MQTNKKQANGILNGPITTVPNKIANLSINFINLLKLNAINRRKRKKKEKAISYCSANNNIEFIIECYLTQFTVFSLPIISLNFNNKKEKRICFFFLIKSKNL